MFRQGGNSKAKRPASSIAPGFGFSVLAQARFPKGPPPRTSLLSLWGKLCSEAVSLSWTLKPGCGMRELSAQRVEGRAKRSSVHWSWTTGANSLSSSVKISVVVCASGSSSEEDPSYLLGLP